MSSQPAQDGVWQIHPTIQGGASFFMDMSLDDPTKDACFAYDGINLHPKKGPPATTEKKTEGGVTYYSTPGAYLEYGSGGKPGKSIRLGIFASKGSKNQKQKHIWKEKPDFLYDEKGIRNHEFTGFVRLHNALGNDIHKSLAMKVCGGTEDAGRSLIETCYPIDSHDTVRANYNYEHFPYVHVMNNSPGGGVKQFFDGDYCQDNKWVGLKHVHIVSDDKKQSTNRLYVDTDPFDTNGKLRNNWRLKAEWIDKGSPKYNNIPCTWRSEVDKIRMDGWSQFDFTLMSIREIEPHTQPAMPSINVTGAQARTEPRIVEPLEQYDNLDGPEVTAAEQ